MPGELQTVMKQKLVNANLERFPKLRNGRPDYGRTSHFDKEIGFFQEFLIKTHLLRGHYLRFDWSGWIVLIKSEFLITTGMVWQVSSDKWKPTLAFDNHADEYRGERLPKGLV